jgi:hypothetical protein
MTKTLDMGITGTYDVLLFSFLLPQEQVLQLLPSSMRSPQTFMPVPTHVISSLDTTAQHANTDRTMMHPILLQMGYQISTGPGPTWLPKFSFNEAKLEVPFLRHPSGKSNLPYAFKQHMYVFSHRDSLQNYWEKLITIPPALCPPPSQDLF